MKRTITLLLAAILWSNAMATELRSNSTRSPRFSTSKALGFKGGSTGANGNLQQPTMQQLEGTATPPAPPADTGTTSGPAISQFSAPKAPGLATSLATTAAGAVAGEGAKQGLNAVKGALTSGAIKGGVATGQAPVEFGDMGAEGVGNFTRGSSTPTEFGDTGEGFSNSDVATEFGDTGGFSGGFGGPGGGGFTPTEFGDTGGFAGDFAAEGAVEGGIPGVGAAISLARGNPASALGSLAGGVVGGPVGAAIGGALGGSLGGDCFITEAVMSAGGAGDTAPELEALRQFRDQTLATTPQGQALIAEYEAIAPIVVEAIMQHPDNMAIFQSIDAQFINPAVSAIQAGDPQKALQIYAQMIAFVTPYAAEVAGGGMPGDTGDADAMAGMGEHAAMLGHDAGMTSELTGQMAIDHTAPYADNDPNGYDGGPQPDLGGGQAMQNTFAPPRY